VHEAPALGPSDGAREGQHRGDGLDALDAWDVAQLDQVIVGRLAATAGSAECLSSEAETVTVEILHK
jgi:hypothetical protein